MHFLQGTKDTLIEQGDFGCKSDPCCPQEGSADQTSLLDSVSELQDEPKNLAVLFNDYAVPFRVWDVFLEIVAAANHNDPTYNRQLWDAYLTQARPRVLNAWNLRSTE